MKLTETWEWNHVHSTGLESIENTNKIYIVNGYINESGDEDTWIEELFEDKEQANACCEYLNITNTQKNVTYWLSENDGICMEDYVSKLEEVLNEKER